MKGLQQAYQAFLDHTPEHWFIRQTLADWSDSGPELYLYLRNDGCYRVAPVGDGPELCVLLPSLDYREAEDRLEDSNFWLLFKQLDIRIKAQMFKKKEVRR